MFEANYICLLLLLMVMVLHVYCIIKAIKDRNKIKEDILEKLSANDTHIAQAYDAINRIDAVFCMKIKDLEIYLDRENTLTKDYFDEKFKININHLVHLDKTIERIVFAQKFKELDDSIQLINKRLYEISKVLDDARFPNETIVNGLMKKFDANSTLFKDLLSKTEMYFEATKDLAASLKKHFIKIERGVKVEVKKQKSDKKKQLNLSNSEEKHGE